MGMSIDLAKIKRRQQHTVNILILLFIITVYFYLGGHA